MYTHVASSVYVTLMSYFCTIIASAVFSLTCAVMLVYMVHIQCGLLSLFTFQF